MAWLKSQGVFSPKGVSGVGSIIVAETAVSAVYYILRVCTIFRSLYQRSVTIGECQFAFLCD